MYTNCTLIVHGPETKPTRLIDLRDSTDLSNFVVFKSFINLENFDLQMWSRFLVLDEVTRRQNLYKTYYSNGKSKLTCSEWKK